MFSNGVAGAWALAAHRRERLRVGLLWPFTIFAQSTILLQGILGAALVARSDAPAPELHTFYGFVSIAAVGIVYSYRTQMHDRRYLLYGVAGLFLMGMGIRGILLEGR